MANPQNRRFRSSTPAPHSAVRQAGPALPTDYSRCPDPPSRVNPARFTGVSCPSPVPFGTSPRQDQPPKWAHHLPPHLPIIRQLFTPPTRYAVRRAQVKPQPPVPDLNPPSPQTARPGDPSNPGTPTSHQGPGTSCPNARDGDPAPRLTTNLGHQPGTQDPVFLALRSEAVTQHSDSPPTLGHQPLDTNPRTPTRHPGHRISRPKTRDGDPAPRFTTNPWAPTWPPRAGRLLGHGAARIASPSQSV
jgi:hypothetical protein